MFVIYAFNFELDINLQIRHIVTKVEFNENKKKAKYLQHSIKAIECQ